MENQEILALFDKEQRIELELPEARKERLPEVVRFIRQAPGMNFVSYAWIDEANADRVIQEQVDFFRAFPQPFEWVSFEHDRPSGLSERLIAHGFAPDDDPGALMVLDLREIPSTLLQPVTADVRPVTTPEQLEDVIQVLEQVWERSFARLRPRLTLHLEVPGYLSIYTAWVEGQPACTGWTYFHPHSQFAGIWGGSTLPAYRGRGLYTAVLAARAQEAVRRGYRFLFIEASPMSKPIVAKHDFRQLSTSFSFAFEGHPPGE